MQRSSVHSWSTTRLHQRDFFFILWRFMGLLFFLRRNEKKKKRFNYQLIGVEMQNDTINFEAFLRWISLFISMFDYMWCQNLNWVSASWLRTDMRLPYGSKDDSLPLNIIYKIEPNVRGLLKCPREIIQFYWLGVRLEIVVGLSK